jgi:hypothetical protein
LLDKRPVEAVELPDLGHALLGGVFAGECQGRIAGNELEQPEHGDGGEDDDGDDLDQPAADGPDDAAVHVCCRFREDNRSRVAAAPAGRMTQPAASVTPSYFGLPRRFGR